VTGERKGLSRKTAKRSKSSEDPNRENSRVTLDGVVLRSLTYSELTSEELQTAPLATDPTDFRATILPRSRDLIEFELCATVKPQSKNLAFNLVLLIGARFKRQGETSGREFVRFVAQRGGGMILPYVRELVSNITGRGIYRTYYIDPVVLEAKLAEPILAELASVIDTLPPTPPPWSKPSDPLKILSP
jgi:hypothetical protein